MVAAFGSRLSTSWGYSPICPSRTARIRRNTQPTRQACNTTCQPAFSPVVVHDPARGALPGEVVAANTAVEPCFVDATLRFQSGGRRRTSRACLALAFERGHFTSPRLLLRHRPQSSDRLRHEEKIRFAHDGNRSDARKRMLDDRDSSHEAS